MKKLILLLGILCSYSAFAQTKDSTRVLIITAHPDDESAFAATVYKITHEAGGAVDIAVITNGEGGYKYSTIAEPIYNLKLTDEAIGRKHLPTIRKKELMAAGNIIGISNYYFLDQQDNHYTLDVDTVLNQVWDYTSVKRTLNTILEKGNYDYVFCLLPSPQTHGHHKGATILALQTVSEMKNGKHPIVLAASNSNKSDSTESSFKMLDKFPITKVTSGTPSFNIDRTTTFGYKNSQSYMTVYNLEIAEHKSQGSVLVLMNKGDYENFWYFDINDKSMLGKTEEFFKKLSLLRPSFQK